MSVWTFGGLTLNELARRVWAEMQADEVFGRAAQLAYYFLLALFPLLLFLVSLLGYFAGEDSELRDDLFRYLSTVLPGEASQLVRETATEVIQTSGGGKLSFGILAALWAASNGMGAISDSLNIAYDVKETRPWWKARLVAVGLTIALAVLIISALTLVLAGHEIAEAVAASFGLGDAFEIGWKILQWPIVLAFVLVGFGLIYYFAPNVAEQKWHWITPGAVLAVALWLLVSFGFRTYLYFFNSYSATYGSLGAVIILMLWFYLTGAAILIGGEINSEIEHEAAKAGAPDVKEKGEKKPDDPKEPPRAADTRRAVTAERAPASFPRPGAVKGPASTTTTAAASPSASTRLSHPPEINRHPNDGGALTFRKIAVVAGAWVLSRIWRGSSHGRR